MGQHAVSMGRRKKIALVAHDNKKADLLAWARFNRDLLARHDLFATGTTGSIIVEFSWTSHDWRAARWEEISRWGQRSRKER